MKTIRVGAGQGFWGDSPIPVIDVIKHGNIQYLAGDALAELTLAILQKQKQRNPQDGYVKDLIPLLRTIYPEAHRKGIKILTNAGGINLQAAGNAVEELLKQMGITGVKIALVHGDNLLPKIPELIKQGVDFSRMENGERFNSIEDRVLFANTYLGALPMVEALKKGADIVITGRSADPALFLAPLIYEFDWKWDDWNRMASGILMGHLMECSAQSTGGNFGGDWWNIPMMERPGYPIGEANENGDFIITKPEHTGGLINLETIKEQMLYEVHDPENYLTPDVIVDFTSAHLEDLGDNRVRISNVKGKPRPEHLKVSIGYQNGYLGEGNIRYSWPDALAKAKKADEIIRKQFEATGLKAEEILTEFIGVNSLFGQVAKENNDNLNEVGLRIAVRTKDKKEAAKVPRYFPPLALNGPPTASGVSGMPKVRELISLWSSLIPRDLIENDVTVTMKEV